MKEFILSLIMPLKMKKYRFMSVLIAILIFIATIYLLSFPHQIYMNNNKDEFLAQKAYVNAYINLPQNLNQTNQEQYQELLKNKYKVNKDYQMTSSSVNNQPQVYDFENIDVKLYGDKEEKTINIHIVFDINDTVTTELNNIKEDYLKLFPDDANTKANYASYIYFLTKKKYQGEIDNTWKNNKLTELHETEEDDLLKQMDNIDNFDLFGVSHDGYDYLLIFLKDSLVTHIPYYDESKEKITYPALSSSYSVSKMNFDFSNCQSLNEFGNHFANIMFKPLSSTEQTEYLMQVLGYVLLFPAVFVLILSWAMKKRGVMKTYKEYYNVASIASVVPTIIVFIIGWFVPKIIPLYGALFCVFVLFSFIKINSTPELGD